MDKLIITIMAMILCVWVSDNVLLAQSSVTDIEGTWTSVDGGRNIQGVGTSSISWGFTNGTQSGYIFEPTPVAFPIEFGTPFELGTFTHNNFPIALRSGISGATLDTSFDFIINGTPVSSSTSFDFLHNETFNSSPGCCDDIVTAVNNIPSMNNFFVNGREYQLDILGFRVDGGDLLDYFQTKERQSNVAKLFAQVNEVPIPEPSTYLLLSSFLLVALIARRHRVKENTH